MNMTNLEHALYALAMQAAIVLAGFDWAAGAFLGAGFFIARELTQAEYRWIESFGHGKRANLPWWGCFDLRVWKKSDCWLDWVVPTVAVIASALIFGGGNHA